MSSFWKDRILHSRVFTRYGRGVFWASNSSWLTLFLHAYLLGFKLFELSGWMPITGWFIIFLALNLIYVKLLGIFYRPTESFKRQSDNYLLSVAEMEVEKSAKETKDA